MTIHLPNDLETSIQAAVQSGRFASVDDAVAGAARLLLRTITQEPKLSPTKTAAPSDLRPAAGHLAGRPRGDRRDRGRSDATAARGTLPFTFPSSDPFAFLARAPGIRWPTGQINSPIESPWEAHHG